jgi:putative addiction module CopG family antidote
MLVQLAPDLRKIVDDLVSSGAYETEDAVLRRALRDLAEREQMLAGLQEAIDDVKTGRVLSVDESERRVREKLGFGPRA